MAQPLAVQFHLLVNNIQQQLSQTEYKDQIIYYSPNIMSPSRAVAAVLAANDQAEHQRDGP